MRNFQDTFETSRRSFISAFSICMTVTLRKNSESEGISKFMAPSPLGSAIFGKNSIFTQTISMRTDSLVLFSFRFYKIKGYY